MKHISLDFWQTVGRPHPLYARARTSLISNFFDVSFADAEAGYRASKVHFDSAAENDGLSFSREENFIDLAKRLGVVPSPAKVRAISNQMDDLFRRYPPVINPDLKCDLARVRERGLTLSIGSNTNFVMGEVIRESLVGMAFSFEIFSDEIGVSKPHPAFFQAIVERAKEANPLVTSVLDIVHVGDSQQCDGLGAVRVGMEYRHTPNSDMTASVVNILAISEMIAA